MLGEFGGHKAFELAQEICNLAQEVDLGADDGAERIVRLHCYASMLQRTADSVTTIALQSQVRDVHGRGLSSERPLAFKAAFLVQCLVLCNMLKSDGSLLQVVRSAVSMVLPSWLATPIVQRLECDAPDGDRIVLPHESTISRARLSVDTAYMSLMSSRLQKEIAANERCVRYYLVDSSPQGHRNYELISETKFSRRDGPRLLEAAHCLERLWAGRVRPAATPEEEECEQNAMTLLRHCIQKHGLPCVVIGSGAAGLSDKYRSFMHALFLESPSAAALSDRLSGIVSFTSDQGVEFGLALTKPIPASRVFPWLPELFFEAEGVDEFAVAPDDFEMPALDMSNCIAIAGCLHIIHNSSADLRSSMGIYDDTVHSLTHVSNLVRRAETHDRLLATCFADGPARYLARGIRKFSGKVHPDRWGTIAHAAVSLLDIERALRAGWDLARYGAARAGDDDDGARAGVNLETANNAILSDFFWDSLKVFGAISKLLLGLMRWAESCSCHGNLDLEEATVEQRMWETCPMRGRRGPDMVMG